MRMWCEMGSDSVSIVVKDLGKKYSIGGSKEKYLTFRDAIVNSIKAPLQQLSSHEPTKEFWALKDISFNVEHGEVIGIIGRNGAGKSTLLKILSRITSPTEGSVDLYGRVGSLLEIGTGFHPELTGRENIFLSGSILGMKRQEIDIKLDEIVKFSEIERFLDTPVKRYSSGMYVRLAFAVAAHMDTEILLVDEVLAVGDAAFQKKCLGKMEDVARKGRTVIFVSHNMGVIQAICKRAIWLDKGKIVSDGITKNVIEHYLTLSGKPTGKKVWADNEPSGNNSIHLNSVYLLDSSGSPVSQVNISEDMTISIEFSAEESARAQFSIVLFDSNGTCVFGSLSNTPENEFHGKSLTQGRYRSDCILYGNLLNEGRYHVSLILTSEFWQDGMRFEHIISFDALDDGLLRRDYSGGYSGLIRPKLLWKTQFISNSNNR